MVAGPDERPDRVAQADLLDQLARERLLGRFARLDPAAGQRPERPTQKTNLTSTTRLSASSTTARAAGLSGMPDARPASS